MREECLDPFSFITFFLEELLCMREECVDPPPRPSLDFECRNPRSDIDFLISGRLLFLAALPLSVIRFLPDEVRCIRAEWLEPPPLLSPVDLSPRTDIDFLIPERLSDFAWSCSTDRLCAEPSLEEPNKLRIDLALVGILRDSD